MLPVLAAMGWPLYLLLVISVSVTVPQAVLSQAVFSLIETSYAVREGDQFAVEIKKAGTAASPVNVVVQVRWGYRQAWGQLHCTLYLELKLLFQL